MDQEQHERIENNRLKKSKALDQLGEHPDFQDYTHLEHEMAELLEKEGLYEFKQKLVNTLHKRRASQAFATWSVAASVLIIILSIVWLRPWKAERDDIFTLYFQPYENVLTYRTEVTPSYVSAFLNAYDQQDYRAALMQIDGKEIVDSNVLLYVGICHLALDEPVRAIERLKRATLMADEDLTITLTWYLGLAYLMKDDSKQAKVYLQKLIDQETSYALKATEIMRALETF